MLNLSSDNTASTEKFVGKPSVTVAIPGCDVIVITGKTVTVAVLELNGSLTAFPVERAVPAVTGDDD